MAKREALKEVENRVQKVWEINNEFQAEPNVNRPKFFGTFPYPYMNGKLHLGHAYTICRMDFFCRYMRQKGINTLFPFSWHGTGMPIVACANKVKESLDSIESLTEETINALNDKDQIKILFSMGVPIEEIPKFADPYYWINYFPKEGKKDLLNLGISADFSRSFMTTDANPYYDSFVKWQFELFRRNDMVKFGKKHIIYSVKDGQPCADHDRSVGEGVEVKEYTCLKYSVIGTDMSLLILTTRVELLYVATNIWMENNDTFIIFMMNGEKYVCKEQTLKNLKYQVDEDTKLVVIGSINSSEFIGKSITNIRLFGTSTLPIIGLSNLPSNTTNKIAIAVPGHNKFDFKNVSKVSQLVIASAISVNTDPEFGINLMKSKTSSSDEDLTSEIAKAESLTGMMSLGEFLGYTCVTARAKINQQLFETKNAFKYCEPETSVISRSGDLCIVSLTDQWFINYANPLLKEMVNDHIKYKMEVFDSGVKSQLLETSNWITDWPCSRSVGLGTKLFDTEFLIDSLSDSTIYMALYTIYHKVTKIPTNKLTFKFWDYIFRNGDITTVPDLYSEEELTLIKEMRNEFLYWYPLDMRISGKDLIGNHLTMCLYSHAAIWNDNSMLPRSFSLNGHTLLNGKKMSKSEGNFLTIQQALENYGADATRMALANACGTAGTDDANFTEDNATDAIMKLHREMEYCKELIEELAENKNNPGHTTFWEDVFENEINKCIVESTQAIEQMNMQRFLFCGFQNLITARDTYRSLINQEIIQPNYNLLRRYLQVHLSLIAPVCPHYATEIWNYAINHGELEYVPRLSWPKPSRPISTKIIYLNYCLDTFIRNVRTQFIKMMKLGKKEHENKTMILNATIYSSYSEKEMEIITKYINCMNQYNDPSEKEIVKAVILSAPSEKEKGFFGRFAGYIRINIIRFGVEWLKLCSGYIEEFELITKWAPILLKDIGHKLKDFNIQMREGDQNSMKSENGPGKPLISLVYKN